MTDFLRLVPNAVAKVKVGTSFSPAQSARIGEAALASIQQRFQLAGDIHDSPAKDLADGYKKFKQRRVGSSVRDLRLSGRLYKAMAVLQARPDLVRIGFENSQYPGRFKKVPVSMDFWGKTTYRKVHVAGLSVHDVVRINNRRSAQWGLSPNDKAAIVAQIKREFASSTFETTVIPKVANG